MLTFQDWQQHSWCECVWECVWVCVRGKERESPAYFPPSLCALLFLSSLPRSISPPRSLASLPFPPLHFLSIISSCSVCVSLSLPPFPSFLPLPSSLSLSLSLYPLLSLSLAVHHFWRWMSPRLKLRRLFPWLAAIHKLAIKKKGERKTRQKSMGGGRGGGGKGGGEARKYCPYIPVSISWLWNRETGEVRGWRRGWTLGRHTVFFLLFSYCECIHKAVRKGRHWKWLLRRIDCMMFDV